MQDLNQSKKCCQDPHKTPLFSIFVQIQQGEWWYRPKSNSFSYLNEKLLFRKVFDMDFFECSPIFIHLAPELM